MVGCRQLLGDFDNLVGECRPITRQLHLHRLVLVWPHRGFLVRGWARQGLPEFLDPLEEILAAVLGDRVYGIPGWQAELHALVPLDAEYVDLARLQLLDRPHQPLGLRVTHGCRTEPVL